MYQLTENLSNSNTPLVGKVISTDTRADLYISLSDKICWEHFRGYLIVARGHSQKLSALYSDKSRAISIINWFKNCPWSIWGVIAYFNNLREKGLSPSTLNRHRTMMISFSRYLSSISKMLFIDVADHIKHRKEIIKKKDVLQPIEVVEMLKTKLSYSRSEAFLQKRNRAMIALFATTSCRSSDIASLKWNDLDLEKKYVTFRDTKNGEDRTSKLLPDVYALLLEVPKISAYVFCSWRRKKWYPQGVNDVIKKTAKLAGIEKNVTSHTFRRSLATQLFQANYNDSDIAELIGWKSIQCMVQRYKNCDQRYHDTKMIEQPLANYSLLG